MATWSTRCVGLPQPPPTELVVTNLDDSGSGSLRDALARIADDGTITFDPGLAGGTITLSSGQLAIDSSSDDRLRPPRRR